MNMIEFANAVSRLSPEDQIEFFERLKGALTDEEIMTVKKFVGLHSLLTTPAKYKAVRSALCESMFSLEVPFSVRTAMDF